MFSRFTERVVHVLENIQVGRECDYHKEGAAYCACIGSAATVLTHIALPTVIDFVLVSFV